MKRRKFIASSVLTTSAMATGQLTNAATDKFAKKELYEFREYEMKFGSIQGLLHQYLEKAFIPALNRYGVKNVGVFKEMSKSEPPKIYVLIVYPSFEEYISITAKVNADAVYKNDSVSYHQAPADKPLYSRIKTSFLIAFDGLPALKVPAREPRIFELRTYEGYSEDAVRRKIKMFNEEEFEIFYRTRLTPVFFGEAIAGDNLPCLTYMITFKDLAERDKNWQAFGADAQWKKVSADPQYANTVSNIRRVFLEPLIYSQV